MRATITLPENISDITLGQFLRYEELKTRELDVLQFSRRKLSIFTSIPYHDTINIQHADFEQLFADIDTALTQEVEFTPTFHMHGIEFGFIPNLDAISLGEFVDLTSYGTNNESLHKTMAILFRPVVERNGSEYAIAPYVSSEHYAEMMKDMPMHCVNGALLFFYRLANELQEATQKYLTQELQKEMLPQVTSPIGAGTQRLKSWLMTTLRRLKRSPKPTYTKT